MTVEAETRLAADVLEQRVSTFESRLFHGLLLGRAAIPAVILVALVATTLAGDRTVEATVVWIALTAWTIGTTPWAWGRLAWARRAPWPFSVEIAVFVGLLFAGFGTRQWHLLHAAVPIVFCALLTRPGVAWLVSGAFVVALVASDGLVRVGVPIEQPTGPALPSLLYLAGTAVLLYVRRLIDDLQSLADARRQLDRELLAALEERTRAERRLAISRAAASDLGRPLEGLTAAVRAIAPVRAAARSDLDALARVCAAAENELARLGLDPAVEDDDRASTLGAVIAVAVRAGEALGGTVVTNVPADAASIAIPDSSFLPLQRVLTEAVANAVKHGDGSVDVTVEPGVPPLIEVVNASPIPPRARSGGRGLDAMRADAQRIGARLIVDHLDGKTVLSVTASLRGPAASAPPSPQRAPFAELLQRRHRSYELAMGAARVLVAVQFAAVVWAAAANERAILSPLPLAAVALVAWAVALALWWRSSPFPGPKAVVAAVDGVLVLAGVIALGGVGAPWSGVAMGSAMSLALHVGAGAGVAFAAAAGAASYPGWEISQRTGSIDFLGAQVDVPETPVVVGVTILAVGVAFAGARWAFGRVLEAVDAYQRVFDETLRTRQQTALDDARAEAQRDLHASIRQLVTAAELRLRTLGPSTSSDTSAVERRLREADGVLRRLLAVDDGP